jgi:stage II sporulation protein D
MKKDSGKIKWVLLMLGLTAASVILTAAVVIHMVSQEVSTYPWETEESEGQPAEIRLENIYITGNDSDTVSFIYEGETYRIRGFLKEPCQGVADLCISDGEIKKIYRKQAQISGAFLSYSDEDIEVEGYGLLARSGQLRVYRMAGDEVAEIDLTDLAIGDETLTYIVGDGKICAILAPEETVSETIRVLIKNQNSIEYDTLYLTGSEDWSLNGNIEDAQAPIDMVSFLNDMNADIVSDSEDGLIVSGQVRTAAAVCPSGLLYITDSDGNKLSEGYEGTFLVRESDNGVVLINQISIEDYVRYVLPSEMEDFFPYEAQKAQAVCARTFACYQMKNTTYTMYGANLDDSTSFQVYNRNGTTARTDQAVADTAGEVIVYEGSPIACYYYSTSPGMTETLEVWNEESPDYISASSTLLEQEELTGHLTKKADFIRYITSSPRSYDSSSPYYRWTASLDVSGYENAQYGKIENIAVTKRSKSGYALELTVTYEKQTDVLTGEYDIRTFLGRFLRMMELSDGTYRDSLSVLPSACFIVREKSGDTYSLAGGGFGHGIGMSQYAAGAMAEEGKTYTEIINYFYKNVEIVKK